MEPLSEAVEERGPQPPMVPRPGNDLLALAIEAARLGDIARVRWLHETVWILSHPAEAERVLITDHAHFRRDRIQRSLAAVIGQSIATVDDPGWTRHRKMMAPAFHKAHIQAWSAVMAEEAARLAAQWERGGPQDVLHQTIALTFDVVQRATVGDDPRGRGADLARASLDIATNPMDAARVGPALALFEEALARAVAWRRAEPADGNDLLGALLAARDAAGVGFDDRELRDEAITLFFAAGHTSGIGLSWTFHFLAQHPDVQTRVVEELRSVLDGRLPTAADVPRLPLTSAVVAESFRLRPPGYGIGREVAQPWSARGFEAAPGTIFLVCPYNLHHDARWWDEPDAFRPDRWLHGNPARHRFAYIPFSVGPRTCIGASFAQMEALMVVATLLPRVVLRTAGTPRWRPALLLEPEGLHLATEARPA